MVNNDFNAEDAQKNLRNMQDKYRATLDELKKNRTNIISKYKEIQKSSIKLESAKRLLQVEIDASGMLKNIIFNDSRYKNIPSKELASIIVETYSKAKSEITKSATDKINSVLPSHLKSDNNKEFDIEQFLFKDLDNV